MKSATKQISTAVCGFMFAATLAAGAQIVVHVEPPSHPVEVVPPSPQPSWVWQAGYERWDGNAYVWVPGHYVQPPYEDAHWVAGHWANRDGGYVWIEGHWRR